MKTKTIDRLIEICTKTERTEVILCDVLAELQKIKQRKEQKKVNSFNNESLSYANGIALGIANNYTLEQKREIMNRARMNVIDNSFKKQGIFNLSDRKRRVEGIPELELDQVLRAMGDTRCEEPWQEAIIRVAFEVDKIKKIIDSNAAK